MAENPVRKVLLTGDTVGGVWTFTLELAEGLIQRGMDVCLVTFGRKGTAVQRAEAEAVAGLRWMDSDFKLEWMEDPWMDVEQSGRWLLDISRSFNPDVVHLNTLCHAALDWSAPVLVTVHSCVASWWAAVKREPLPSGWNHYVREVKRSLAHANVVTAPSHTMLQSASRNYGFRHGRVIYNGRRPERFRREPKESFILAAGRLWDEGKNIRALAELAPRLRWPVYLAGESADVHGCFMLGQLSSAELASWYARASIYALPARYEPFGLSALEAALSGCALVLGDIPTLREIWGDAALYDSDGVESAVRALIEDTGYREAMAERAFARAQQYTRERMVDGYASAYAGLAERRLACAS